MYRFLNDKFKTRTAFISEDYKTLLFTYEFRSRPLWVDQDDFVEKTGPIFDGEFKLNLTETELMFSVGINVPNLELLYKIALVIAYILGGNITIQFYYKCFPYYTSDRHLNLHDKFSESFVAKRFLRDPQHTIEALIRLLEKEDSHFRMLAPAIMQINAMPMQDLIFVAEYGLLQSLSNNFKSAAMIFDPKGEALKSLEKFSAEVLSLLSSKFPEINLPAVKNKLSVSSLNSKGTTKEKIASFLQSFDDQLVKNSVEYLDPWNKLRNSSVVTHGVLSNNFTDSKSIDLCDKLHTLLLRIVVIDVNKALG